MQTQWQTLMKPAFLQGIRKISGKDVQHIMEKVSLLAENPLPDGDLKKHLTHCVGKPYRIRSGDYRIFYTFNQQIVNIYKIDRRNEGTYKDCPEAEFGPEDLSTLDELEIPDEQPALQHPSYADWDKPGEESLPFPEPITVELLKRLAVPAQYHNRLLRITNQGDLLACPGVEDEVLLTIDAYMFDPTLSQTMQQPDLVLNDVDDLLRYREGELLSFLLKLSPEQEKYTRWPLEASGPTLVKGGPGTGKSTVALYRVRSLLEQLRKNGKSTPRILFTTYTNALIKASEQQLQQLLGPDIFAVDVNTADKLAYTILQEARATRDIISDADLRALIRQALQETVLPGNALQQAAQRQTLSRMGLDYLLQEINNVIVARQLGTLEAYQNTPRAGRKMRLNATQRQAVWLVYERWAELVQKSKQETWQQRRARAATLVEQSSLFHAYDAVVIDEAQDLDPSALRMLANMCKSSTRLFITADANQSIYSSGFTWQDIHQDLKFQGRTSILRANYRSTAEIGEAATSYLASGTLESEIVERQYINSGPLPDVRSVESYQHEVLLLASFFKKASRILRLTLGSCAVLCPNKNIGQAIASDLSRAGLEANYMEGRDLNLTRPGIKVLTLNSSKGLEFPIVALAGFLTSIYPVIPRGASEDEQAELVARERRTMFVGMTRAMRALLVVVPANPGSELLEGFDPTYWNFNRNI